MQVVALSSATNTASKSNMCGDDDGDYDDDDDNDNDDDDDDDRN